ncbi:MAG: tetratricopeptide repeat protein [Candidatus Hydrogenedentes bacterium]|nr:tetratricopeptide repeat protein [Candidatus Hydrogenedentota bacterium]
MPVSTSVHVADTLHEIIMLNPASVLDIGCGFGKWGYLCREYLDVFLGRVQPHEWTARIDGIEFFEPYIMPHQRFLYNNIYIGDVCELSKSIGDYEMIIAGDVIEHIDKDMAEEVVERLYARATRALLVNIPIGEGWIHPEAYGNPAELHRSVWYPEDFRSFQPVERAYQFASGLLYGTFVCRKSLATDARVKGYLDAVRFYEELKDPAAACRYLRRANALDPGHLGVAMALTDYQLKQGAPQDAVATLERCVSADAHCATGHLMLAQVLRLLGATDRAQGHLAHVLTMAGASEEERQQAGNLRAEWGTP